MTIKVTIHETEVQNKTLYNDKETDNYEGT